MTKDNAVIFKGNKSGIVIILDHRAEYERIKQALEVKIKDAHKFFGDAKTNLTFKGKDLEDVQIKELLDIINKETDLDISYVSDLTGSFEVDKKQELVEAVASRGRAAISPAAISSYVHHGSLRSGQVISHRGAVILLGDVNAGAEVVASESITVMGAIRGMVHAGAEGDARSIVCALNMQPTQLRIADKITYMPPEVLKQKRDTLNPVYAFIEDGQIYIAPASDFGSC